MARIMVAVMPFAGHIAPVEAVVGEFLSRGHSVRVYTGSAYADRFRTAGARVVPWQDAPDFDEHAVQDTFPQLRGKKGLRQTGTNLEYLFIRSGAGQYRDLSRAWDEEPWDVLLADGMSCGAALVAERTSAPWATLSVIPLMTPSRDLPPSGLALRPARGALGRTRDRVLRALFRLASRKLHTAWNETREAVGLPRTTTQFTSAWVSSALTCVSGLASLDYPRSDLPATTHYVGRIRTRPAASGRPAWWADVLESRVPVVHVTQGTLNVDPDDLLRPTMVGLADAAVLVVAATGHADGSRLPFPVPPNARVAGMVDYDELLPLTSVVITNGGWGGVLTALSYGIPLIVAGGDIDKPEIAARVAYSGAGIDLRTGTPSPAKVAAAYRRVAADSSFRAAAGRLADDFAGAGGAGEVVERCEALIR
ncbi:nucleotide disphospho-sugar-binding domain-containing protein [Mycetocola sp. 2940]|uniref:glycosyltransferase n=1 Tax=Mycetocola sp. 2940 TaxID=3156452 RepID=UPI003393986F